MEADQVAGNDSVAQEPVQDRGEPPALVKVKKSGDAIPVQVRSWAHFDELVQIHGEANVEVAS